MLQTVLETRAHLICYVGPRVVRDRALDILAINGSKLGLDPYVLAAQTEGLACALHAQPHEVLPIVFSLSGCINTTKPLKESQVH